MADVLGAFIFEVLTWPAGWLTEKLWLLHRKEPTWRRVVGGTFLSLVTVVIWLAWIALIIAIPVAIVVLVGG